jgi:tetratricopeptide (TPR) repeat protein
MKKLSLLLAGIVLTSLSVAQADQTLVNLVKKVKPGVVLIETFDKDNKPLSQGSGFFVNNKGHIVTNHHVIEGAYSATIKTSTGKEYPVQGIVAKDIEADIVKLVVNIADANITFLKLSVNVPSEGEDIVVIGNPFGLESTISSGIVSAVRDIPAFGKILQITAPVSPGSDGSPVLNNKGEVIGIATLIFTKNLNFVVPSDRILALEETDKLTVLKDYATQISKTEPNDVEKLYAAGFVEVFQGNWEAAIVYFQKALTKKPNCFQAYAGLGTTYSGLGSWKEAIEAFKQAIKIKPDYAAGYYALSIAFCEIGQYQQAAEACKEAIKIYPNYADAHLELGFAYGNLRRNEEAIEAFNQAIRIKPDFAKAYFDRGIVYSKLGRSSDALKSFKQAINIKPDYAEAYYNLGVVYGSLGSYQEVIEMCKQAIKIKPDYAEAYYNLGVAYGLIAKYIEAIDAYKKAISFKSDYAEAYLNLGAAYSNLGRDTEAIEPLNQAIKIKETADAYANLGVTYANLGRYSEAIDPLKKAIKIKPDLPVAHFGLGVTYLITGDKDSALEEYKILKTLDVEKADKLFNLIYK